MPQPGSELADLLARTRTALLVVDMQNDFCADDGYVAGIGLDTAACRAIVDRLDPFIAWARGSGVAVLWTWANYDEALVPPSLLRKKRAASIVRECCVPGTAGYEPFGVAPADGEPVFVKHCYSAFTNPDLERHLREAGIETLIFAGVQTNVCIESTLRDAFNAGFNTVVVEDCVASHTPPLHAATLANVRALFGHVAPADEIEALSAVGTETASPAG